jgi:hypothetical protein
VTTLMAGMTTLVVDVELAGWLARVDSMHGAVVLTDWSWTEHPIERNSNGSRTAVARSLLLAAAPERVISYQNQQDTDL